METQNVNQSFEKKVLFLPCFQTFEFFLPRIKAVMHNMEVIWDKRSEGVHL